MYHKNSKKRKKASAKLPVIISAAASSAVLAAAVGIAVGLRRTVDFMELRLSVLENSCRKISEKVKRLDERKLDNFGLNKILKNIDIPDDTDIDLREIFDEEEML